MSKRIGILGGISHQSTIRFYDRLMASYFERRGDYYYPEVVIFSLNFQRFTDFEDRGDRAGYVAEILRGVSSLEAAGADFIVMSANSPHAVFDEISRQARVPLLSMVRVTAERARALGLGRLLLLGIKFTMQSDFYQRECAALGIRVETPDEGEQDEINRIIFEELARGEVRAESRARLREIIERRPADGVILGCTELPMILGPGDAPKPLLDTLALHAEAALDYALDESSFESRLNH